MKQAVSIKNYAVIGHRGTGKTSWCLKMTRYFSKKQKVLFLDLDQEIEKQCGQSVSQLFLKGERYFRDQEIKTAQRCFKKAQRFCGLSFISLGAGFQGCIPENFIAVHLQRYGDAAGRIFFDRPRILSDSSVFEEYHKLFFKRQNFYEKNRDIVFTQLDYFHSLEEWDHVFFGKPLPFKNGVFTLQKEEQKLPEKKWRFFLNQKKKWKLKYIEIRDDLVSKKSFDKILKDFPLNQIIFSFRKKNSRLFQKSLIKILDKNSKRITVDRPWEWGPVKSSSILSSFQSQVSITCSLHRRKRAEPFSKTLKNFSKAQKTASLKLAVPIRSFKELWQGHLWQRENPKKRSFHPRSRDGRWKWHRQLFGVSQPLYFIKEDYRTGVKDQPAAAESVFTGKGCLNKKFACVLGSPVEHSATPYEQSAFFKKYNIPVVKILMKESEMTMENIKILENLGMKFAAVTAPLKKRAFALMKDLKNYKNLSPISAVNTLIWTPHGGVLCNTDIDGAQALKRKIDQLGKKKIAVWGGRGVRDVLKFVYDNKKFLSFYSARTGKILMGKKSPPDIVIWAAGRSRMKNCQYPPLSWNPQYVFDVNYTEDSPGREYALKTKAYYESGRLWFKAQARSQRKIFQKIQLS